MARKLRLRFLTSSVLTLLLGLWLVNPLFAQMEVKSSSFYELSFKEGRTVSVSDAARIGLDDHDLIAQIGLPSDQLKEFNAESPSESGLYYVHDQGGTALGYPYTLREDRLLINLSLKNSTDSYLDQLTLAFDFLYLFPDEKEGDISFQLSYRVGNGRWISPEGARFSSSMLEAYREGWNSFSLQMSVSELFMRPNDEIEIRWTAETDDRETFVPVALQRLELIPAKAALPVVKQGSLVISELLPFTENRSEDFAAEYIELYNLSDQTVNLKGFTVRSGQSEHLIQHDLKVDPYETVVLGYTHNKDLLVSTIDYHYNVPLMRDQSGSIALTAGDTEPVRATYQAGEQGRSLELDHISSAFDGYSSLQNFQPSENEITRFLYGSPGQVQNYRKLYSTQVDQAGWHFLYAPGVISDELNRLSGADLYRFGEGNELTNSTFLDLPAMEPFWIHHHGETEMRIFSKYDPEADQGRFYTIEKNGFVTGGNFSHKPILLNRITTENGVQAFPAIQVWDRERQQFKLLYNKSDEEQIIEPWSGFIAPVLNGDLVYDETASRGLSRDFFRRSLSFTLLRRERGGRFTEADQPAVIAFFDMPDDTVTARLDLPVLQMPSYGEETVVSPLIYLENHLAAFDANRFMHLPFIPEEPLLLGMGTRIVNDGVPHRISWSEPENFPDDWIIELRDDYTDTRINMRENRYYEFRARSSRNNVIDDEVTFGPYTPEEPADRFFIYISPYPDLYDAAEEAAEQPESVKLHQNYPNPFNPATTISFYLPERSQVRLGIYNVVGQQVGMLKDEQMPEGDHAVVWNAIDMPSGIYIVQLETRGNVLTRKITLIK